MQLHSPFQISGRLAPALHIGQAWLSFDNDQFVLDLPDGTEHVVTGFNPPRMRVQGCNPLQDDFQALLSFLGACAESRSYGRRRNGDPMSGDNADLFPEHVGQWAEDNSDEITMLQFEIEESETDLIEG